MIERVRLSSQCSIFEPSPVLMTESAEEFERFSDGLHDELKPRGLLERFYVADITAEVWESRRLRRVKTHLINSAFRSGLKGLLQKLIEKPEGVLSTRWYDEIAELADKWFGNERDKKKVLEVLGRFGPDAFAVEAAALRSIAEGIETINRLMVSQEARLSRSVRWLAELRGGFGRQLHAKVERVIDGKVLALDDASKKPPPAAA